MKAFVLTSLLATLVAVPTSAHADVDDDPPTNGHHVYSNLMTVGVVRDLGDPFQRLALVVDGSHRLGSGRTHLHAEIVGSEHKTNYYDRQMATGAYQQLRVGLEARGQGWLRLVGGADVGYGRQEIVASGTNPGLIPGTYVDDGLMFVPRVAVEAGDRFRVRATFETQLEQDHDVGLCWSLAAGAAF